MAENTVGGVVYDKAMQDAENRISEMQEKLIEAENPENEVVENVD